MGSLKLLALIAFLNTSCLPAKALQKRRLGVARRAYRRIVPLFSFLATHFTLQLIFTETLTNPSIRYKAATQELFGSKTFLHILVASPSLEGSTIDYL